MYKVKKKATKTGKSHIISFTIDISSTLLFLNWQTFKLKHICTLRNDASCFKLFSALKSHDSNKYYVNGNWVIDLPKGYNVAGTTLYYTRPRRNKGGNEAFIAAGPTDQDLDVMVRRKKLTQNLLTT